MAIKPTTVHDAPMPAEARVRSEWRVAEAGARIARSNGGLPRDHGKHDTRLTRVLLLISDLEFGGAQRQLVALANHLDPARFDVHVCSLSETIDLARDLRDADRRLHIVPKRWRFDFRVVPRVAALMRRLQIDLVHAYLFDADIVARLAARLAGAPVVVSSARNAAYPRPLRQRVCLQLTADRADALIANSHAGKRFTVETLDLPPDRIYVVHNGIDTDRFGPGDGSIVRRELGLSAATPVVGMIASFKPQKNHEMFLRVAARVRREVPDVQFLVVGESIDSRARGRFLLSAGAATHRVSTDYKSHVHDLVMTFGLNDCCHFLRNRSDMPSVYAACDLTVLTSHHEGHPNVVLESMACGVPAVATDVADNRYIIPSDVIGRLVPPNDDAAMARHVCELLRDAERRQRMGAAARAWIGRQFSTWALAGHTADVYSRLLAQHAAQ